MQSGGVPDTRPQVYGIAVDMIRRERPELLPHFTKTVGHSIGFRFKESVVLGERCFVRISAGEVYNVQLGFAGLAASARKARPGESASPGGTMCTAATDGDDGDDTLAAAAAETVTMVVSDSVAVTEGPRGSISTALLKACVVKQRKYVPSNSLLPLEIMVDIFALLDPISLGRASCVCRSWRVVGWTHVDFQPVLDRVKWTRQTGFTDRVIQKFAGGAATSTSFLDHVSRISQPYATPHAPCDAIYLAPRACWMRMGACNPMLMSCPIHFFR